MTLHAPLQGECPTVLQASTSTPWASRIPHPRCLPSLSSSASFASSYFPSSRFVKSRLHRLQHFAKSHLYRFQHMIFERPWIFGRPWIRGVTFIISPVATFFFLSFTFLTRFSSLLPLVLFLFLWLPSSFHLSHTSSISLLLYYSPFFLLYHHWHLLPFLLSPSTTPNNPINLSCNTAADHHHRLLQAPP